MSSKLLIITQVMDTDHPILGFFVRWVLEFSKHAESVTVICLQEGKHDLPENVRVYTLGKRPGQRVGVRDRLLFLWRFYRLIIAHRHEYDHVFVHIIQLYILLGYPVWRLLGKRMGLWYAHGAVSLSIRMATKLARVVFTASPESLRIESKKKMVIGHGIDTKHFAPTQTQKDIDLITIGRISPAKHLDLLVDLLEEVRKSHNVSLTIIGAPNTGADHLYERELKEKIAKRGLDAYVHLLGPVPHRELPPYLNRARVFVHAATTGSLDKALLEPMACGVPIVTNAPGAVSLPLENWYIADRTDMRQFADTVATTLSNDTTPRTQVLRRYVEEHHSVESLVTKIVAWYKNDQRDP